MAENSMEEDQSIARTHLQLQRSLKWLDEVTNGAIGYELEARSLRGLQVIKAQTGFLRCSFIVPATASDMNGNRHIGAIATIIDNVGGAAIYSTGHHLKVTVNFNIQYHSTAKIQEEVEIEAKVNGDRGKLTSVVIEVRNKSNNGRLIAIATQWTAANDYRSPQPQAKL
ncbi:proline-rich receptor-like protein kinase PERK1 [Hibiscus syriacus]|uniref:Acyl-coenzyme A thioesterase 13 n=1 Tax=Hibiscus syriacus TaxID=106335 RepID=A0A6A3AMP8_HIBSY|nr:uncharacterized protein LOC120125461 [Hibiscus syriacus]KAE8705133.1 proline-rich receptor-like protein kinase PERK1 [Hibiscus syriacus]